MTTTAFVVLTLAWAAGRSGAEVGSLALAVVFPQLAASTLPLVVLRGVRDRRASHGADVLLLLAVSAELRAGATMRGAVIAVGAEDARLGQAASLARAGRPMPEVLETVAGALGRFGSLTSAALGMASATGGSVVKVMDQLVAQAMALDDLERERRAAMAPILLQAAVVGGVPAAVLVGMAVSGRLFEVAAGGPVPAAVVALGSGLVVVGTVLVGRIARRSVRV